MDDIKTDPSHLSARPLGQLLLMQSVLESLQDEPAICAFVARGLTELPGVAEARVGIPAAEAIPADALRFPLQVGEARKGELWIRCHDRSAFQPYEDYLRNFCFMLAVILEERQQLRLNEEHQARLEQRVQERTRELEAANDALRANETQLQSILSNTTSVIFVKDVAGRYLRVNRRFEELFHVTREQIVGRTDHEYFPKAAADAFRANDLQVLATGIALEAEELVPQDDGTHTYLSVKFPLRDAAGAPYAVCGIATDITERKRAEEALRMTRFSIEHAADALYWITPDARLVDVNEAACRSLGYTRDELLRLTVPDVDLQYDAAVWPAHFEELRQHGSLTFESVQRAKDGRRIPVEIVANYVRFGDEERNCAFVRDITERKRAVESLTNSEKRFRALSDNLPGVVYLCRNDDRYSMLYLNDTVKEVTGYSPDDFLQNRVSFVELYHPEDQESVFSNVEYALNNKKPFHLVYRLRHKEGGWRWVEEWGTGVFEGDTLCFLEGFLADITEQKSIETERENLQAQLTQSQKMESVGRLAGGVAHDFNNMLQAILGNAALALQDLPPGSPLREPLEEIEKSAQRSADLTRQLLAFARKQTVAPRVLDLNETIQGMLKMLRRLISEDIDLTWLPGKELWPVNVDPSQVDQILANLCVNARDAIASVGKITIETANAVLDDEYCAGHADSTPGHYVLLAVSDNGCGMDAETLSHLFEPFFTTKALGHGTGLGLATVYGAVKQNHGFIDVYSEPGQGTTFKIYLPRHAAKSVPLAEAGPAQAEARGSETILLVEDEPAILSVATKTLERLGYRVLAAGTPGEAIRLAREHRGRIDLLMTDVVMPEMNGRDLARNLQSLYPDIRRLFMSGYTANVIAHQGVLDPGVHFLQKPFSAQDLGAKVREALGER
jgi:PAS domain S-box-containing protein